MYACTEETPMHETSVEGSRGVSSVHPAVFTQTLLDGDSRREAGASRWPSLSRNVGKEKPLDFFILGRNGRLHNLKKHCINAEERPPNTNTPQQRNNSLTCHTSACSPPHSCPSAKGSVSRFHVSPSFHRSPTLTL